MGEIPVAIGLGLLEGIEGGSSTIDLSAVEVQFITDTGQLPECTNRLADGTQKAVLYFGQIPILRIMNGGNKLEMGKSPLVQGQEVVFFG